MKHYLFLLITVVCSLFLTSCGEDSILGVKAVEKTDLTTPLFLAFDNTLDSDVKKIWAFNETEAVKGTITEVGENILRVNTDWYYDSWSYTSNRLTLGKDESKKTYDLAKVTVLGYEAISFGKTYVCIPSTNRTIDGTNYESDWYSRGLTNKAFWEALRKSHADGASVDIQLNK